MLIYLALLIIFLILFSLYGFFVATHPQKLITSLSPKDLGWKFEEVKLIAEDGVKLAAWLVPSEAKTDRVIILLHGYPADKANLLYWAQFLYKDFNLFFLDFRYFGDSEGSITTIGYREQSDLKAATNYLKNRGFDKIGVMGFSLGGAVGILTASKDNRIEAIVSYNAFANIDLMGHEFYQNLSVLKYPLTFLARVWAQILLGINTNEIAPEKAARNLTVPILLIHSKSDQTIPFENAERLKRALKNNQKAEFFFPNQGTHGFLPEDIKQEYEKKVIKFFKQNL